MIPRSVVVLFAFVLSVALAGNDTTQSIRGNDGRMLVAKRPGATVTTNSASQSTISLLTEPPCAPLDCSPLSAFPAVSLGTRQTIAGQCFVVTDGGEKIRLAQVEVCIYPQREFEWYAQEVNARSETRFEGMKSIACPANFAALSLSEMDHSLAAAEVLRHDLHVVWQILPTASASTTTGADGHFSITHHVAPPYIIFAIGSRTFGGETEYYRWQMASSLITNPMQVELSNDQLR